MEPDQDETAFLDELFDELQPLPRSILGPGFRESLSVIGDHVPLDVESVPSGTDVFDWTVPPEWHIHEAYLEGPDGRRYADFGENQLSVVNYSAPVDRRLSLDELQPYLYSSQKLPDAIPYVTTYYERDWGFCLPRETVDSLPDGEYHAYIDAEFVDGELNYGHTVLPGESDKEVLLSTYLCHPEMANNELSGPLVATLLYNRLEQWDRRRYTYRFVFCPETIGSITYLSRHGDHLQENLVGGLVLTCLGGPESILSYKRTRRDTALIDRTVEYLRETGELRSDVRSFAEILGSDERQYCSVGFDLPVGQMARTVYEEYDEYHTSADDKEFMGIDPLVESASEIESLLERFEYAGYFRNLQPYGEPMLSKRDLYPTVNNFLGDESTDDFIRERFGEIADDERSFFTKLLTVLHYSDGDHTMLDIAELRGCRLDELAPIIELLEEYELLEPIYAPE